MAKKQPTNQRSPKRGKGRPFTKGDPRINRTIPGPGRPLDEFKMMMAELVSSDVSIQSLEEILKDANHKHHMAARHYATDHGYGKPKETIEHSGSLTLEQVIASSHGR